MLVLPLLPVLIFLASSEVSQGLEINLREPEAVPPTCPLIENCRAECLGRCNPRQLDWMCTLFGLPDFRTLYQQGNMKVLKGCRECENCLEEAFWNGDFELDDIADGCCEVLPRAPARLDAFADACRCCCPSDNFTCPWKGDVSDNKYNDPFFNLLQVDSCGKILEKTLGESKYGSDPKLLNNNQKKLVCQLASIEKCQFITGFGDNRSMVDTCKVLVKQKKTRADAPFTKDYPGCPDWQSRVLREEVMRLSVESTS